MLAIPALPDAPPLNDAAVEETDAPGRVRLDPELSKLLRPVERKQYEPPAPLPHIEIDLGERSEFSAAPTSKPSGNANSPSGGDVPSQYSRVTDFTPRLGTAGPTEWERFWYEQVEPIGAQYWFPAIIIVLALIAGYWRRVEIFAAAKASGRFATRFLAAALPFWREVAVIGLLSFIAWRLT
jgi:hypothetical protein